MKMNAHSHSTATGQLWMCACRRSSTAKGWFEKDVHAGGAQSQQEGCCSAQSYIVGTKQQNNDDADDDEDDDVQPRSQKIVFSDSNFCD
jgi:hypothetical protein